MPKYYCDYCKSYLTHDTMSVRKSHLQGRNHIKFYCDYYEAKAKETNIWNPLSIPYEMTLEKLNRYSDGEKSSGSNEDNMDIDRKENSLDHNSRNDAHHGDDGNGNGNGNDGDDEDDDEMIFLPPPPNLPGLPLPPPAVYNNQKEYQKAILRQTLTKS